MYSIRIYKILIFSFILSCAMSFVLEARAETIRITHLKSVGVSKGNKQASISGVVKNAKGQKVGNALVTLKGLGRSIGGNARVTSLTFKTTKVKDGHYSFKNISPGKYRIIVKAGETGETQLEETFVNAGEAKKVDFSLKSLPLSYRK